jgi:pyruvyltransferase
MIHLTYHKYSPNNWGDFVAPVLCKMISGQDSVYLPEVNDYQGTSYAVIGSILGWLTNPNVVVWGCGFISESSSLQTNMKITAVRGKLTRDKILQQGFKCPEVYGDPVLLFSRYYKPVVSKKYKLGIIPHYIDKDVKWIEKVSKDSDVKIIDICGDSLGFVDEVLECEMIVSSSLHGLILADSYGIPNLWIKLSENVGGKGFKFRDYFSSINKPVVCLDVNDDTSLKEVYSTIFKHDIEIDLDLLINNCPFK